jgi:outer membrane receptor protein involved in Fe transport
VFRIPATTLVNASLTFRTSDNHYDLILQGSNLFDKLYATNIAAASNGAGGITFSPTYGGPRFVQVELRYRW